MFSMWTYVSVAAVIALVAFAIGQFASGFGVAFALVSSSIWLAYSVKRQKDSTSK